MESQMTPDERRDKAAKEHVTHEYNDGISFTDGWNQCRESEVLPLQKRIAKLEEVLGKIRNHTILWLREDQLALMKYIHEAARAVLAMGGDEK